MKTIIQIGLAAALAASLALAASTGASAADLGHRHHKAAAPVRMDNSVSEPAGTDINWSGLYIGVDGTLGGGSSQWDTLYAGAPSFDMTGGVAGVHIGMLRQMDHLVIGWEANLGQGQLAGDANCPDAAGTCKSKITGIEALRGKVGFAAGRMLVYGTAGFAWDQAAHEEWCNCLASGTSKLWATSGSQTKSGYVLGAGLEAAITSRLSLGAEYLHYDFGDHTADLALDGNYQDTAAYHDQLNVAQIRLSYKLMGPGDREDHVPLK